MSSKKIIITKDGRKKSDIVIGHAGKITFNKETVVINDESPDCKAKTSFFLKVKAGNPDAEIVIE